MRMAGPSRAPLCLTPDGFLAAWSLTCYFADTYFGLQVIALLVISGVHLAYLRLYAPFLRRVDQVCEMISAAADVIIFICVLVLVGKDGTSDKSRCALQPFVLTTLSTLPVLLVTMLCVAHRRCLLLCAV